ncbi:uncharacterized protein LAESUDRAFT_700258 [Laetiporus sulphureus 93-53]|uniref:Uncharacterized protein n=1 Tax=Laetiporus sulphureus 93-53 TaxID=1314785 RepID=A0A165E8I2_9APHY|nr:uncharacterized protein LAESUDRAFT_700258 [Laetiporus sulphureus 93-53]KZT06461.1 hypothetical protein LAESUDRAFT_700258 [Laetiporus sulphureus 93-53]
MISARFIRLSQPPVLVARPLAVASSARFLHISSVVAGHDPSLQQGTVSKQENYHPGDPHDQAARAGQSKSDKTPLDAASQEPGKKASREGLSGNPEGVGFAEQVGSASTFASDGASAEEGKGGQEESTPPGFFDAVKSKLGFQTTSGEVKQNRGGGEGVTGTGTFARLKENEHRRGLHTSAVARMADPTKGQAPDASRQPKDRTYADQNDHLKHRSQSDPAPSQGKGNAAEQPSLPSHQFRDKTHNASQKRMLHTSARRLEEKHTTETYSKDVDNSPPSSKKTHQVDPSGTGAQVVRPNEPVTGEFSRAGPNTEEYETVDKRNPYDLPGKEKDEKFRYGGTGALDARSSKGDTVSKPGEGPEGASAGGHHPEKSQ